MKNIACFRLGLMKRTYGILSKKIFSKAFVYYYLLSLILNDLIASYH